ncbi:histidine--tRNA ligase [Streptomyces sp. NPDC048664]|uniref:histidine--tRNA ligase n=1 Tax=Streptomyces sp. NPDC048664 TaxID=3154505 RepID=UPI00343E97A9
MSPLLPTAPYRGTRDFLPAEMSVRQQVFNHLYETVERYGYGRYDGPVLESAEIYEAKSGQEIANQQLYSLTDRGGRRIALRPEMTPSAARMIAHNAGSLQFPVRWYSHVNCHRYERPQRGRTREHWQLNVDIFGSDSPNCEIEIFELIHDLMGSLGADRDMWMLRVGDRAILNSILRDVVRIPHDAHQQTMALIDRWEKTPADELREQAAQFGVDRAMFDLLETTLGAGADILPDLPEEVRETSTLARVMKSEAQDLFVFDPFIVRGLQYYTSTVFEVFDRSPENNRSLFGGGRYNDLAGLFTKQQIPGIGFGMGDVTLHDFLDTHNLLPQPRSEVDVTVIPVDDDLIPASREIARLLRHAGIRTSTTLEPRKLGKELARADRSGARYAVIAGRDEWQRQAVVLRDLHDNAQHEMPLTDLAPHLTRHLTA